MRHELKTWPNFFNAVFCGMKRFEVRKNDRGFNYLDVVVLREWSPESGYTGRETRICISYILTGGQFGIEDGYCVFGWEAWTNKVVGTKSQFH